MRIPILLELIWLPLLSFLQDSFISRDLYQYPVVLHTDNDFNRSIVFTEQMVTIFVVSDAAFALKGTSRKARLQSIIGLEKLNVVSSIHFFYTTFPILGGGNLVSLCTVLYTALNTVLYIVLYIILYVPLFMYT